MLNVYLLYSCKPEFRNCDGFKILPTKFCGVFTEDLAKFVRDLELVWLAMVLGNAHRGVAMNGVTRLVLQGHFDGAALVWYSSVHGVSFDGFVLAFKAKYVDGAWKDRAFRELSKACQKPDKSVVQCALQLEKLGGCFPGDEGQKMVLF